MKEDALSPKHSDTHERVDARIEGVSVIRHTLWFGNGEQKNQKVCVYEFLPDVRTPGSYPTILAPGLSDPASHYDRLAGFLARKGQHMFVVDSPFGTEYEEGKYRGRAPRSIVRRASVIDGVMQRLLHEEPVQLMCVSQGAWYGSICAQAHTERVRKVVLVAPAGISTATREDVSRAHQTLQHLTAALRLAKNLVHYSAPRHRVAAHSSAWRRALGLAPTTFFANERGDGRRLRAVSIDYPEVYMPNTMFQVRAAHDVVGSNIMPLLRDISSTVPVSVVLMGNDRLFPEHEVREKLADVPVDIVTVPNTGHISMKSTTIAAETVLGVLES